MLELVLELLLKPDGVEAAEASWEGVSPVLTRPRVISMAFVFSGVDLVLVNAFVTFPLWSAKSAAVTGFRPGHRLPSVVCNLGHWG